MLIGLLLALTRLNNGDIPGLRQAIGDALGIDYAAMMRDRGVAVDADSLPARSRERQRQRTNPQRGRRGGAA